MLRSLAHRISSLLPAKAHFLLIQPLTQPKKVLNTLRYHAHLYKKKDFRGLHLGSGTVRIEEFCNIDTNTYCYADVVSRLEKLKLRSESVEIIYCSHLFEHIPRAQSRAVLTEWHRVLKPNGKLYICVPDLEVLFKIYLDNLPRYDTAEGRYSVEFAKGIIYGGQVDKYDFHYEGYSFATLAALLRSVGFTDINVFDRDKIDFLQAHDASAVCINETPISLNVVATKVTDANSLTIYVSKDS
jgi:predicted SAM-dependent methyltransferase